MKRKNYNTKQQEAVLTYIKSLGDKHTTAAQITEHLKNNGLSVGRTTVYRHLEKLEQRGLIRRYTVDGSSAACFQYAEGKKCSEHFHLKCEDCGSIFHMDCDFLKEVHEHIGSEHSFAVNSLKSIIYGKCINCVSGG